jgi:4-amino-4-deoxy-L-arabinose transferase-like glycosyltransferase
MLGVTGALLIWFNTPWGIGVGYDSVYYLKAADNLLSGFGLSRLDVQGNVVYLTHYPPLYPLVVAVTRIITGTQAVVAARLIASISFGILIFLTGFIVLRLTGAMAAGVLAALVIFSSPVLIEVNLMAMSESIFLVLLLLLFIATIQYLSNQHRIWLVVAALFGAGLYLARYSGIVFIGVSAFGIILFELNAFRKRLSNAILFGVLCVIPILFWFGRNYVLTGSMTNRVISFHPPSIDVLRQGLLTITTWGIPNWIPAHYALFFILLPAAGLIYLLITGGREKTRIIITQNKTHLSISLLILYILFYMCSLLLSLTFFDASTKLNNRILSPVYLLSLIIFFVFLWDIGCRTKWKVILIAGSVLVLVCIALNTIASNSILVNMREKGMGFTGQKWQASQTIDLVRQLPQEGVIYSNEAFPIYFLTGRPAGWIPELIDNVKDSTSTEYARELEEMKENIIETNGSLVIFTSRMNPGVYPPKSILSEGLELYKKTADGEIYIRP